MLARLRASAVLIPVTILLLFGAGCTPEEQAAFLTAHAQLTSYELPNGPSPDQWAALRNCENGGSYTSLPKHTYRGAYQFDFGTWRSVGGSGDPALASPAEQDMRAKKLYSQRGWHPWPRCGRFLR